MEAGVEVNGAGQQQASGEARTPEAATQKRGERPRQQIRRAKKVTRRRFSVEEKIRIVMEGIRGEEPVSVLCRREGIDASVYYRWLKDCARGEQASWKRGSSDCEEMCCERPVATK